LRGEDWHRRRVWLSVALISGFILGGALGAWGFTLAQYLALALPAALAAVLGVAVLSMAAREPARETA
jgi:uncharacterized membrane protein YoaK (UPF0700 family)